MNILNIIEKRMILKYIEKHVGIVTLENARTYIDSIDECTNEEKIFDFMQNKEYKDKVFMDLLDLTTCLWRENAVDNLILQTKDSILIPSAGELKVVCDNLGNVKGFEVNNHRASKKVTGITYEDGDLWEEIDQCLKENISESHKSRLICMVIFSHILQCLCKPDVRRWLNLDYEELFEKEENEKHLNKPILDSFTKTMEKNKELKDLLLNDYIDLYNVNVKSCRKYFPRIAKGSSFNPKEPHNIYGDVKSFKKIKVLNNKALKFEIYLLEYDKVSCIHINNYELNEVVYSCNLFTPINIIKFNNDKKINLIITYRFIDALISLITLEKYIKTPWVNTFHLKDGYETDNLYKVLEKELGFK